MQRLQRYEGAEALGVRTEEKQRQILEKIGNTNGGNENRQRVGLTQGLVGHPLDQHAQNCADNHRHQHGKGNRQTQVIKGDKRRIASHHQNIAVCEIQHLGNTIYHCVAQRDNRIYRTETDTTQQV